MLLLLWPALPGLPLLWPLGRLLPLLLWPLLLLLPRVLLPLPRLMLPLPLLPLLLLHLTAPQKEWQQRQCGRAEPTRATSYETRESSLSSPPRQPPARRATRRTSSRRVGRRSARSARSGSGVAICPKTRPPRTWRWAAGPVTAAPETTPQPWRARPASHAERRRRGRRAVSIPAATDHSNGAPEACFAAAPGQSWSAPRGFAPSAATTTAICCPASGVTKSESAGPRSAGRRSAS